MFVKRQAKGDSAVEKQLAGKAHGKRDARKMRAMEEIQDRYSMLTREHKIWQQRKMGKSVVGNFENDTIHVGFASNFGLSADSSTNTRQFTMPAEVTDIGSRTSPLNRLRSTMHDPENWSTKSLHGRNLVIRLIS
jgi:hypothetical protein